VSGGVFRLHLGIPAALFGMRWFRPAFIVVAVLLARVGYADAEPGAGVSEIGDAGAKENPIAVLFKGQRLDLWSLKPLRAGGAAAGQPPKPGDLGSGSNELDLLVRSRLAADGLAMSGRADARTLVRRLSFDLTGLPPAPGDLPALEAGGWANAEWIGRFIDRSLASPRFGEHWARLWLDVVRYSDSNGFDWDEFRPQAWRFRDYVIRAFNADTPFDRFVAEQLAGDELVAGAPRTEAERDALIATGFLRIGPQDNSAKLFNEEDRARHELLTDLTETTGSAFLGLTLACCRCHDHKTEPLSQADHFRMRAFFEGVAAGDDLSLDLEAEQEAIREAQARVDAQLQPMVAERAALVAAAKQRLADTGEKEPSDDKARETFTSEEKARHEALDGEINALKARRPEFTRGLLMTDSPDARERPAESRRLEGGDHRKPAEVVPAGFPSILDPGPARVDAPPNPRTSGRRLALARWLTRPDNPLTARVYVNRVWQALFGTGLVASPNDFGYSGDRPTHPELLDWLAVRFMADGWSTKRLIRLIVMSETYQQAAGGADPARLAGRPMRRLTAEQLRDAQLAVGGLLLPTDSGPPVWPELPREVLTANPAFLDDNETKTKGWYPSPPEMRHVRSVFLVQKRTVRVPLMETFDLPENATSCGRRTVSTVAPQALALLNGPLTEQVASALARRIEAVAGTDPSERVATGFRLVLQRSPNALESARIARFLDDHSLEEFARVLVNLNEFVYLD